VNSPPKGRPLSHWLEVAFYNSRDSWDRNEVAARTKAEQAIKEMGPAVVPVLVSKMSEKEGARIWFARRWNRDVVRRAPEAWRPRLEMDAFRVRRHRAEGHVGFEILGTNAASAVPALRELLCDDNRRSMAIRSLGAVRTDEALAGLIPMLRHIKPGVRAEALDAVLAFGERAVLAADEIAGLTDDEKEDTAVKATRHVGNLLPANRAIPLLLGKFNDPRPAVARAAVRSFTGGGPEAEPVMPAIAAAFKSPDLQTRQFATNALKTINPYRATEFGIDTNGMSSSYYQFYHRERERLATNTSRWHSW
jgi:HEAT repeat protein